MRLRSWIADAVRIAYLHPVPAFRLSRQPPRPGALRIGWHPPAPGTAPEQIAVWSC